MAQRIHWLTKYTNKNCHAHSDMHSIPWPHYSTTIPTYVSSHGMPFTATYVQGWLLNNVAMAWSACVHACVRTCMCVCVRACVCACMHTGTSCLCTYFVSQCIHWAIPRSARFLFNFFFYGDLFSYHCPDHSLLTTAVSLWPSHVRHAPIYYVSYVSFPLLSWTVNWELEALKVKTKSYRNLYDKNYSSCLHCISDYTLCFFRSTDLQLSYMMVKLNHLPGSWQFKPAVLTIL